MYSSNVATNVGKVFFKIIEDCFPPNHVLHKICNKNTIKMSYRTMPNMEKQISRHNKKVLQEYLEERYPGIKENIRCNCIRANRPDCPMPGRCYIMNVVYECTVTRTDTGHVETYTGVSKDFKGRYGGHKKSFLDRSANQTALSSYIWSLKDQGIQFEVKWRVIDRGPPFNPLSYVCRLCTLEKYHILFSRQGATLNQRSEFFSKCWHVQPQLLAKS